MRNPNLLAIITGLNSGPASLDIAIAQNFRFDQRPDPHRSAGYDANYAPATSDFKD